MSTPVEPLRLLLLADTPEWAALLRECLVPMGDGAVLISAPNWDSVSRLFDDDHSAVLLTTPNLQPGPGRCSLPCVLLLEQEPLVAPLGVSDWLIRLAMDAAPCAAACAAACAMCANVACWKTPCSAWPNKTR